MTYCKSQTDDVQLIGSGAELPEREKSLPPALP